jgi:hypothetical protein
MTMTSSVAPVGVFQYEKPWMYSSATAVSGWLQTRSSQYLGIGRPRSQAGVLGYMTQTWAEEFSIGTLTTPMSPTSKPTCMAMSIAEKPTARMPGIYRRDSQIRDRKA